MSSSAVVKLPQTTEDFISMMRAGLEVEILHAAMNSAFGHLTAGLVGRDMRREIGFSDLSPLKQQLVKYTGSALKYGRPLSSCVIIMAGQTGRGIGFHGFLSVNNFDHENSLLSSLQESRPPSNVSSMTRSTILSTTEQRIFQSMKKNFAQRSRHHPLWDVLNSWIFLVRWMRTPKDVSTILQD